jgi:hypothetical protein
VGQSNTNAIVTSDLWKDASDGTVEGHFDSWNIDGTITKTIPSATVPVGVCGAHTLNFTANYGPYTGSGSTLASTNGTLALPVAAITYTPKPFVALINAPSSDATNVTFTSASRGTTDTSILPSGTTFTWKWDLLNSAETASLLSTTGTSTLAAVPSFVIPRTTFTGVTGAKVRLQLSTAATLPGTCANMTASEAKTTPLSAPDPKINKVSGCQFAGSACNVNVTSISGADTSGWNVTWSFTPSTVTGGSGLTFSPVFNSTYTGTLTATVTNPIGTGSDQTTMNIAAPLCSTAPTNGDIAVQYFGAAGCGVGQSCNVNDSITFAATSAYKWNANCDQYLWTFGDGSTSTAFRASHAYRTNNTTYNGSFAVTVNGSTVTVPFSVKVGSSGGGGCTTNCGCPQITGQSAFVYFTGASGCSYVSTLPCQPGELISLQANPYLGSGYSFSCGTHTFSWSFGDGSSADGQQVTHAFQSGGTYPVTLTIGNPISQMQFPVTVVVAGGAVCVAPSASNTAITMSGGTSGCTAANPNCRVGENVGLNVVGLNGFSFAACNTSTFAWDFGDGSQATRPERLACVRRSAAAVHGARHSDERAWHHDVVAAREAQHRIVPRSHDDEHLPDVCSERRQQLFVLESRRPMRRQRSAHVQRERRQLHRLPLLVRYAHLPLELR